MLLTLFQKVKPWFLTSWIWAINPWIIPNRIPVFPGGKERSGKSPTLRGKIIDKCLGRIQRLQSAMKHWTKYLRCKAHPSFCASVLLVSVRPDTRSIAVALRPDHNGVARTVEGYLGRRCSTSIMAFNNFCFTPKFPIKSVRPDILKWAARVSPDSDGVAQIVESWIKGPNKSNIGSMIIDYWKSY